MPPLNLYGLTYPALEALLASWEASPAHARAIWQGLYRHHVTHLAEIPELPAHLRSQLQAQATLEIPQHVASQESRDGSTRKMLLRLADGEQIEVVLLRYRARYSACISTQVGCACGCAFCATGQLGFVRDLTSAEIVGQVLHCRRELAACDASLNNFVLMGMGEPLLNYENTITALRILLDQRGLGFAPRRVTLSTVGIAPGIRRLAQEGLKINLAVSLHAATDEVRSQLLPINARYPLDELFDAIWDYQAQTQRRVMFEWTLIAGLTDTPAQATALITRLAGLNAHVNLIRLNPTPDYPAEPSTPAALEAFAAALDAAGIPHTVRQRRGLHIAAGCGQLRQRAASADC
ncbi:MAG TPA: 23S rRNA (adenine(2503)-C(2))-methyltransferase RlmN [Chloroflexi bacterium]|nr:23S rRNA (adenine(2503)-C(2))-methyltransferase RlmN [Chloroflexota bacterium]